MTSSPPLPPDGDPSKESLPLDQLTTDRRWPVPEAPPTRLRATSGALPSLELTQLTTAVHALTGGAVRVLGEPACDDPDDPDGPEVLWMVALQLDAFPHPLVFWKERPAHARRGDHPPAAERIALGVETVLHEEDPLTTYINLLRLLTALTPNAEGIEDVVTGRHHDAALLRCLLEPDFIEPAAEILFRICEPPAGDESAASMRTVGLWRCHRPELELIGLAPEERSAARTLLMQTAELILDFPPGIPGEHYQIGRDLRIILHRADRVTRQPAIGPCAAARLCAAEPPDGQGNEWSCPHDLLRQLREGTALLYRTRRATNRQARMAQRTLDEVRGLIHRPGGQAARLLIKVAFALDPLDAEGDHEHLWFESLPADGPEPRTPTGRLITESAGRTDLACGDIMPLEREAISDWRVVWSERDFGPDEIDRFRQSFRPPFDPSRNRTAADHPSS